MRNKILLFISLFLVTMCIHVSAQNYRRKIAPIWVKNYIDSLRIWNDSIKADTTLNKKSALKMMRISPLIYNNLVANNLFSLSDSIPSWNNDSTLLKFWIEHPEAVVNTRMRLKSIGSIIKPHEIKISSKEMKAAADNYLDQTITAPDAQKNNSTMKDAESNDIIVFKPNFWQFSGDYYLQFLQNYVTDNWYKGGERNYSMMASLTVQANYNNKQKVRWDNKLEMKLGLQTSPSDTVHHVKTNTDLIRYTGKLGLQASKKWYYTFQTIAQTQFMRSFSTNNNYVYGDFMSPLNLNFSIGMDYQVNWLKNKLGGSIHLAPFAYNFKYVDRLNLATRYGIDADHHSKNDFGSECTFDLTWRFSNQLSWQTRLYGYTTYERCEIEWENTINLKLTKYLSSKIFIYPRFDDGVNRDDKYGYFQFKEYVSFGFSYSF